MKKLNSGYLVVGSLFTILCISTVIHFNGKYSKESVDTINKVLHNNEYTIEDFSRFSLNESYHKIIREAEKRRLVAEHKVRMDKIRAEREAKRKAELEKKRLAKLEAKKNEQKKVVVSRGQAKEYQSDWMTFEASYYTANCKGCSGLTKTEYNVRNTIYYNGYRILAADTSVLPLYSLVEVVTPYESFKAVVIDTGSAIKNKKLDVLVSSYNEAIQKGRHSVKLRVIKYGK